MGHGAAPPRPAAAWRGRTRGPPTGGEDGAIAWGEEPDLVIGACCPQSLTRIAAYPDLASGPRTPDQPQSTMASTWCSSHSQVLTPRHVTWAIGKRINGHRPLSKPRQHAYPYTGGPHA